MLPEPSEPLLCPCRMPDKTFHPPLKVLLVLVTFTLPRVAKVAAVGAVPPLPTLSNPEPLSVAAMVRNRVTSAPLLTRLLPSELRSRVDAERTLIAPDTVVVLLALPL